MALLRRFGSVGILLELSSSLFAIENMLAVSSTRAAGLILVAHFASTWGMVGLIWMVQVVHYPLFLAVGPQEFVAYERAHTKRISYIVGPLMGVESVSALALLALRPEDVRLAFVLAGLVLLGVIHASTVLLQVPAHSKLSESYDRSVIERLVRTNWIRTVGWTIRGFLAAAVVMHHFT